MGQSKPTANFHGVMVQPLDGAPMTMRLAGVADRAPGLATEDCVPGFQLPKRVATKELRQAA